MTTMLTSYRGCSRRSCSTTDGGGRDAWKCRGGVAFFPLTLRGIKQSIRLGKRRNTFNGNHGVMLRVFITFDVIPRKGTSRCVHFDSGTAAADARVYIIICFDFWGVFFFRWVNVLFIEIYYHLFCFFFSAPRQLATNGFYSLFLTINQTAYYGQLLSQSHRSAFRRIWKSLLIGFSY